MNSLRQDLKYAFRSLAKSPGFSGVAVATLALGIGASTAVFSIVRAVIWSPLPFPEPERLVVVYETDAHNQSFEEGASTPDFRDFRAARSFSGLAAIRGLVLNLTDAGREPERIAASAVSHELFGILGVAPALGRSLDASDDRPGAPGAVLLSDGIWRARYGASPDVVGRVIALDGKPSTVVGIMPPGFEFPDGVQAWLALEPNLGAMAEFRGVHNLDVVGRLAPDATLTSADAELRSIAARLAGEYPGDNAGRSTRVVELRDTMVGPARPALLVLFGAVVLVMAIACANVSALLLARSRARSGEIAIRRALGAGSGRLVRQLLTESLVLGALGGAAGLLVAAWGTSALLALSPLALPRIGEVGLHLPVLAFTLAAALGTGLAAGLAPALSSVRRIGGAIRRDDSRAGARSGLRGALVVAQVAFACVLVTGAGLLLRSFAKLSAVDPGFRAEGLLTAQLQLPLAKYPQPSRENFYDWPEVFRFYDDLIQRLEAIPGAASAALGFNHPLLSGFTSRVEIAGRPPQTSGEQDESRIRPVSPGYFRTVGSPLRRGRSIDARDRPGAPHVVVVNEAFVRRYFADEDPVGQVLSFWGEPRTVVGVVGDVRFRGPGRASEPAVYPSLLQVPTSGVSIVVRAAPGGDAAALAPALREAVRATEPDVALFQVQTAEVLFSESLGAPRFQTTLLSFFGGAALLLASLGLYGLLAYSVARRTREIGVRMALGAERRDLIALFVGHGGRLVAAGLVGGFVLSLASTRLMASMLYSVAPRDGATFAGVAFLLAAAGLLASWLPARRAASVDPVVALRAE